MDGRREVTEKKGEEVEETKGKRGGRREGGRQGGRKEDDKLYFIQY